MGRKAATGKPRSKRFEMRLDPDEMTLLEEGAAIADESLSEWARSELLKQARRLIAQKAKAATAPGRKAKSPAKP